MNENKGRFHPDFNEELPFKLIASGLHRSLM